MSPGKKCGWRTVEKWGGKKSACASRARAGRRTCLDWGFGVLSRPTVCCGKRLSYLLGHENIELNGPFSIAMLHYQRVFRFPVSLLLYLSAQYQLPVRCIRPQDFYPTSWKTTDQTWDFWDGTDAWTQWASYSCYSRKIAHGGDLQCGNDWTCESNLCSGPGYALRGVTVLAVARGKWVIYNGRPLNFGTTGCANLVIYRITCYR